MGRAGLGGRHQRFVVEPAKYDKACQHPGGNVKEVVG